jgi:hypothetical protein
MKNLELFLKDPTKSELLNNGVAQVRDVESEKELETLRYELETFVCEGQYGKGLAHVLRTYLSNLDNPEQPAVWVSGFYGSGKSHLVKMLRYLWVNHPFPDGATARGIARLPAEVSDLLKELSTAGARLGGVHAAGGTISAGASSVRLSLLGIVFNSVGLPEKYPLARFVMWLKREGLYDRVRRYVEENGKSFDKELLELYVSPLIAKGLLSADPSFASSLAEAKSLVKNQYPSVADVTISEMVEAVNDALSAGGRFPCALIVLDEVQQYIGDNADRSLGVQEVTEACMKKFEGRLLFVGTGQSALSSTPQLQKLQGRFRVPVQLSDTDVEAVIRKVILAKKPDKVRHIKEVLATSSGEISRQLVGTKIEPRTEDEQYEVTDYPLLPVRNRFWERVLRAVDSAGTSGQLRNQLKIVHEAVRQSAPSPLGTVVAGDFIYNQISADLLQTGVLLNEINEFVQKQRNGTDDGELRARLCSLIFLIGKLPREAGSDIGLRATPDTLADLLVEDLKAGGSQLRMKIPELLKGLTDAGSLIQIDNEYRLQTRESIAWDADYRERFAKIANDDHRYASERADILRVECGEQIKTLKLLHGNSKVTRKLELSFSKDAPDTKNQAIPVWVRDGWTDDEKTVLADARRAGTESPLIFVFVPRRGNDELRKALAGLRAAEETLQVRGVPSNAAGMEARQAIKGREEDAKRTLGLVMDEIFRGARVFLGGGAEQTGMLLNAMVVDAAQHALVRLYPKFDVADDTRWDKVVQRARQGDGAALEALGYAGDPDGHPVCVAILRMLGAGKKGGEIRRHFAGPPFGWAQDAIDGALLTLFVVGKIKALSQDGRALEPKQLDQTKIGVTEFRAEQTTITTAQRLAVRKLFQGVSLGYRPNEESGAAEAYVGLMLDLARSVGGDPPLPSKPDTSHLLEINNLSGNDLLAALYESRERLAQEAKDWAGRRDAINVRRPRWESLNRLLSHAGGLDITAEIETQVRAVEEQRALLDEPDPVQPLCDRLTQSLRQTLTDASGRYRSEYEAQMSALTSSPTWQRLSQDQRSQVLAASGISPGPDVSVGTEAEILQSLDDVSLESWRTRHDALRQRFENAALAAAQLLAPKAARVTLRSAHLETKEDVEEWLAETRDEILKNLANGPVIV